MDQVKADKGYAGPVRGLRGLFHADRRLHPARARRSAISSKLRDMEVWLAPIAGTRVLVPFRAQGPTPIGRVVMEATQFVSTALADPRLRQRPKDAVTRIAA